MSLADYHVLIIEDDESVRTSCIQSLEIEDIPAAGAGSVEEAQKMLPPGFSGVVVTDLRLPGLSGMDFLQQMQSVAPQVPVIMITGHGDIMTAVEAMRSGAYDFLPKPFSPQVLIQQVRRALEKRKLTLEVEKLRQKLAHVSDLDSRFIGHAQPMCELRETVRNIAATPANVLIHGETGTGKELLARCIHDLSGRPGNFVALNCGGLPETLFDSEIFGHERGAFSGATQKRIGKIEYAQGGTLFLDEIESMPMAMQIKLLRVLQERMIERLGSNQAIPVDIRVISATKADLGLLAEQGQFRADLNFRLNVIELPIPPLRERREDIPLLFKYFSETAATTFGREVPVIDVIKMQNYLTWSWPGNVRELRNEAERCVLGMTGEAGRHSSETVLTLPQLVEHFERDLIISELSKHHGNVSQAAEALGIAKSTLFDKVKKYALQ
ncbi:sigma-54-dependent Fis family transcriptional regulator [Tatumella sp. JGM100]|nr:sigma-54-dependent Fis family transcriptional regulator [Tatumella sp. JGM82]MBS0891060.1 sigma-54-dependent Fis family transcriptional regulator [Tatumella sp. JGM94]MBS0902119.1 sigma-54-dependent Fis family transcriptional regulator [Tatumella sp. JGM100]